jgi:hypothetical protein
MRKPAVALTCGLAVACFGVYAGYAARAGPASRINLAATPSARRVSAGTVARYTVTIQRAGFRGAVTLWVGRGLPPRAYARFAPPKTRGAQSTLMIATTARTPVGHYRVWLRGKSAVGSSRISVRLNVWHKRGDGPVGPVRSPPFTIAGSAGDLEPGVARSLNLAITNPNRQGLLVTWLTVSIQRVSAPNATAALPCTVADFAVRQFSGDYPLAVPASSTRTLSALGTPGSQRPQVTLVDRPLDQDGCKGASLVLGYGGMARLG